MTDGRHVSCRPAAGGVEQFAEGLSSADGSGGPYSAGGFKPALKLDQI